MRVRTIERDGGWEDLNVRARDRLGADRIRVDAVCGMDCGEDPAEREDDARKGEGRMHGWHVVGMRCDYAKSSRMGSRPKSTRPKGRPAGPGKCALWSRPRLWKMVATMSPGWTGRSAGNPPIGSLFPTTRPPFTPPPANETVKHCGQ